MALRELIQPELLLYSNAFPAKKQPKYKEVGHFGDNQNHFLYPYYINTCNPR